MAIAPPPTSLVIQRGNETIQYNLSKQPINLNKLAVTSLFFKAIVDFGKVSRKRQNKYLYENNFLNFHFRAVFRQTTVVLYYLHSTKFVICFDPFVIHTLIF